MLVVGDGLAHLQGTRWTRKGEGEGPAYWGGIFLQKIMYLSECGGLIIHGLNL
jgi:hypothetical protein